MSLTPKYLKGTVLILFLVLAGSLFLHNLTSINLDIGRHLKLGEIIWQTKSVPDANLFSYTEPDHAFINHHWFSEVIFYGVYFLGGLKSLIIFKVLILLVCFWLLIQTVKKKHWAVILASSLLSLALFFMRDEPRPEIFSYLLLALFLFFIQKARDTENFHRSLWFLPFLSLLWVNWHIYFFIGIALYGIFLLERLVSRKFFRTEWLIGALMGLAVLINPHGLAGVLYPLTILKEYAYGVVENEPLVNILVYGWKRVAIFYIFLGSLVLAGIGLIRRYKVWKKKIFDGLLLIFFGYLAWTMHRNLNLYALILLPILAQNFPVGFHWIENYPRVGKRLVVIGTIALLFFGIYGVQSNQLYALMDSSRRFGWGVSPAAEEAVKFVKDNKIVGPVFNNFEIGSYLIWKLYPEQQVFVDGRPEAYSAKFFNKVYKPMLGDEQSWLTLSGQYGINYIFFNHNSLSDNAQKFLSRINKDVRWQLVFLNETVVIYVKNESKNQEIIDRYKINQANILNRMEHVSTRFNPRDDLEFRALASILLFLDMPEASANVYEKLKSNLPNNPYAYQGAGLAYAAMNDPKTQAKAAENLTKAIEMGLENVNNYFTLGLVYANLGQPLRARWALEKAQRLDPDNQEITKVLKILSNNP